VKGIKISKQEPANRPVHLDLSVAEVIALVDYHMRESKAITRRFGSAAMQLNAEPAAAGPEAKRAARCLHSERERPSKTCEGHPRPGSRVRSEGGRTMNQTEAWEVVIKAADWMVRTAEKTNPKAGPVIELRTALKKVKPRVERMRSRLDFARARKAGTLNRPSWATP